MPTATTPSTRSVRFRWLVWIGRGVLDATIISKRCGDGDYNPSGCDQEYRNWQPMFRWRSKRYPHRESRKNYGIGRQLLNPGQLSDALFSRVFHPPIVTRPEDAGNAPGFPVLRAVLCSRGALIPGISRI